MAYSNVPPSFWAEAINTACFTQNRTIIVKRAGKTAYELINQRKPSIKFLRVFGCRCFVLNDRDNLGKFDQKADEGIFLGYSRTSKAYRIYIKRTRTAVESTNVTFDEREAVETSSHKPSDHATSSHFDESPSNQSDFITKSLFPDAIDLEEYRNPNLTTSTIPPVVDEPVTRSNSSGAIVTESSSHPLLMHELLLKPLVKSLHQNQAQNNP